MVKNKHPYIYRHSCISYVKSLTVSQISDLRGLHALWYLAGTYSYISTLVQSTSMLYPRYNARTMYMLLLYRISSL